MPNLHRYVASFEDNATGDVADINAFKEMLGLIGKSFIGERMFAVIAPNGHTFTLDDWLVY
jgi:hypothetical protein